jgi:oligopeptide/dipeptide ABC transporter ATP-binding protein
VTALEIKDLRVDIGEGRHPVHVLRGADLSLSTGETTGLVGESGSGKSTLMLAVIGLLARSARLVGGSIEFGGRDLLRLDESELRDVRGREIGSIFQNARAALHPLMTVGDQLARVYRRHTGSSKQAAWRTAVEMLGAVGLSHPAEMAHRYPHQLSGGQCQRAMIAMALIAHPKLILADEPTSGLDVTVQKQVLGTLVERVREFGATMLLITHDLSVIAETCDHVAVMYAGEVVEWGPRRAVLERPAHPYTQGLLAALDLSGSRMHFVPGAVPDLRIPIAGCPFAGRCPHVREPCLPRRPEAIPLSSRQSVRCVLYQGGESVAAETSRAGSARA